MSIEVSSVPSDGVWFIADDVLRCFKFADRMTHGRFRPVDILNRIQTQQAILFVAIDTSDENNVNVLGCVVCSSSPFPRKNDFVIEFLGGEKLDLWAPAMWKLLKQFAKSTGHDAITYTGRRGWLRKFPEFKSRAVYAEAVLEDGQE